MTAILKKELKAYFQSPIGYIFTGVFFALCSMFFVSGTLYYQSADLKSVFSNVNIVYLFLVSLLTMGLFAPEKSKRTDQLLFTAPVSLTRVVMGKYMAAVSVFGITLLLSLVYPIIISVFGSPAFSEIIGSYIGFVLLWGTFIAIGMLISALTESQMIAAVVSFGVLLLVYYMDWFAANITNKTLQNLVEWFSVMDRYNEFQNGILNVENILYYLSIIAIAILLTIQVIRRRLCGETKFRINNTIVTAAVIAGILFTNGIVGTIGSKISLKIDLTRDKVYEFSEQTREVLDRVQEDISVLAMYPNSTEGELVSAIKEQLKQYEQMNSHIKVSYIDPYSDPALARRYGDEVGVGSVVVEKGDRFKVVPLTKLYRQSQSGDVSVDTENQITGAISYVLGSGKNLNAYFIEGHNEYASTELKSALENQGYEISALKLSTTQIPEDAAVLISMLPAADYSAEERDALDAYLMSGGKAVFVFNAGVHNLPRLSEYLGEWGLGINNDYAIENDSDMMLRTEYALPVPAPEMQKHRITEKLIERDIALIAPDSCSFRISENNLQGAVVTSLLKTSSNSWGITDMARVDTKKQSGDIEGPLNLAAISEKSNGNFGAVFVLGSVRAVETKGILESSGYSNGDFLLNTFAYLNDSEQTLSIRAKKISAEALTMTEKQIKTLSVLLQYIVPLLILAAGLIVWLRRRYL